MNTMGESDASRATCRELVILASVGNLENLQAMVESCLVSAACPVKTRWEIQVAVEEIFINIALYAYAPDSGTASVRINVSEKTNTAVIAFADRGVPYNPLAKEDPDISLPAKDQKIGGLGIFMTKKLMDEVTYEYRDGQNILTMKKTW